MTKVSTGEWLTECRDISLDEEAILPLPSQWLRSMKISLGEVGDSSTSNKTEIIYRNTVSGLESEEHPLLVKALNAARKRDLPDGWIVKEVIHIDGSKDYFYNNAEKGLSMWDPPMLRSCLADCILQEGFNPFDYGIVSHPQIESQPDFANISIRSSDRHREGNLNANLNILNTFESYNSDDDNNDDYSEVFGDEEGELINRHVANLPRHSLPQQVPRIEIPKLSAGEVSKVAMLLKQKQSMTVMRSTSAGEVHAPIAPTLSPPVGQENCVEGADTMPPEVEGEQKETALSIVVKLPENDEDEDEEESVTSNEGALATAVVPQTRNWTEFLSHQREKENEIVYSMVNRVSAEGLPMSLLSIRVLRSEVEEAGERIHQLVIKLRTLMTAKVGLESSVYAHKSRQTNQRPLKSLITLGSDIVSSLRQNPRYILLAMKRMNQPGSPVMPYIAFITLHRLLHPFSTDNSMTAALLLQGFNSQLDELSTIEQSLNERDYKKVIARALFISDPETAISWNPLDGPMPIVPMTHTESSLTCLLRIVAIRRDVTAYFRSTWRPLLPAVVAVLNVDDDSSTASSAGPHVFANLVSVAHRLLLCAFRERSARSLPATVIAVCQTVFDIGGFEALCYYIFNLLVLPNLLKILAGDHESTENEEVYRVDDIFTITNKYYDHSFWCAMAGRGQAFGPFPSLIWIIWRLFVYATNVEHVSLSSLTTTSFVGRRFKFKSKRLDLSGVVDMKLRNIVAKLYRVIVRYCDTVLSIPLSTASTNSSITPRYVSDISKSSHHRPSVDDDATIRSEATSRNSSLQSYSRPSRAPLSHRNNNNSNNNNPIPSNPSAALSLAAEFKPSELLNRTVVSRYELRSLFSAVGQTIEEEVDKSGPSASIYQAVSEYLLFDNRERMRKPGAEDNCEQFMQLQFLYSNSLLPSPPASSEEDSFQPGYGSCEKDEVFESETDMAARHEQLLRGLKLAHKYEDSLMKMISRTENNEPNDLYDLVCNESWQQLTDFNASFKQNSLNAIQKRHTVGSSKRIKQTNFGLLEPKEIEVFPTSSKKSSSASRRRGRPEVGPPDFKSLKELQKEVIDSYRFGSSSSCVAVGTSMARSLTVPSKLSPNSRGQKKAENPSRSRYTTFDDKIVKSAFLAPTESVLNGRNSNPAHHPTPAELDNRFIRQLRSHEDHPQLPHEGEVGNRPPTSQRRRKGRPSQPIPTNQETATIQAGSSMAKPFPEHLRHRVRKIAEENDDNAPAYFRSNDNGSHSFQDFNSEDFQNMSTTSAYEYKNDNSSYSSFQNDGRNNHASSYYHSTMGDEDENYFTRDEDENDNRKVRRITPNDDRVASSISDDFIASILSDYKKLRLHNEQKSFANAIISTHADSNNTSRNNNTSYTHAYPSNNAPSAGVVNKSDNVKPIGSSYVDTSTNHVYENSFTSATSNLTSKANEYPNSTFHATIVASNSSSADISDASNIPDTAATASGGGAAPTSHITDRELPAAPVTTALSASTAAPTPVVKVNFSGNLTDKYAINKTKSDNNEVVTAAKQEFTEVDELVHTAASEKAAMVEEERKREVRVAQHQEPAAPPTKKPASSQHGYSLNLESLTANSALSKENYVTDLRADRARNIKLRADRLLGRGEREGQGEVEDDPTLPKAISNSASATPVSGARGSTASGNGGSSPGRSTPAVIRRKSVVLSKNESLDVLSKGFIATKYGRSGSRKTKLVAFNEAKGTLEWRPTQENAPQSFSLRRQLSGLMSRALPSTPSASTPDSKEEVRSILVESIVEVRRGVQSAVLQRAGLVDPNCCLSIIHTSYTSASDTSRCYLQ